jgi:hypothetical protein
MVTGKAELRENSIGELLSELSQESAALLREELRLMGAELTEQGRRVAASAGLLGGAGVLGLGAFGALTAALISALGRRPAGGALLVATLYGAGAAALAEAGLKRLGHIAPEAVETIQRDLKAAAKGARKPPAKGARRAA